MKQAEWLMLNFSLPKEPSRVRVSVWRKLKKAGSISMGQGMWLLPLADSHLKTFAELSDEVLQNGGEAYILESSFVSTGNAADIRDVFNAARDEEYREFLEKCDDFLHEIEKETAKEKYDFAEIDENERELHKLSEWFEAISARDFFDAPMRKNCAEALDRCKTEFSVFSGKVYEKIGDAGL